MAVWMRESCSDWLGAGIHCVGSAAEIGWIPHWLLWLVVGTQTPRLAACYWERNRHLSSGHKPGLYLSLPPTRQDLMQMLYFDLRPGPKCHSRSCTGRKWHILMAVMRRNRMGGNWLMKWDELKKFPWYTHRLMHRKRVTCELHDSYFRSVTITQAIPKIVEGTHPDRQISEEIAEVWRRVHISAWEFECNIRPTNWTEPVELQTVGDGGRRDVVGKATSGRRGNLGPDELGSREDADKMQ